MCMTSNFAPTALVLHIWADDDNSKEYHEESDEYHDVEDEYYDADEWIEGYILIGAISTWNADRNFGIITLLDDYSSM